MTDPSTPRPGSAGASGFRIGFVPGVTLTKWRRVWAERFPRTPLEVVEVAVADQRRLLVEDVVDACFVRLPIDRTGLHAIPLYEEVPVVVAVKEHPIAALDELTLADLVGEPLVDPDAAAPFDLVAFGQGVLRVPHSIARSHSRRDLVYRPVTDAEPTTIALAWLIDNPNPLIEEFIGIVRGRTVNSSRTTQSRAKTASAKPKADAKPAKRPAKATPRRRGR
ncbi:MAG TPA: LysR family substrate-binding domain-containing protein [Propionicimonas sp.]|nr:LysR family substrate-binding domain-containing protein [Propionicimonas sp.]HRA07392.1 LysR family substrate-binding domain-containing protein [Propionicimonas sp.]